MSSPATIYGIGLGPGDPELISLKAARLIAKAGVIAHFRKAGRPGNARTLVDGMLAKKPELCILSLRRSQGLPSVVLAAAL